MARSKARKMADLLAGGSALEDGVITAAEVTGLGTAATTAATDYATAGQGTLAASALQPTGDGSGLTGLATTAMGALASTALQPTGDGSGLTGIDTGGAVDIVATGTIANLASVQVKTDGTVEAIAGVAKGATNLVTLATASYLTSAYDPVNKKVLVFYRDTGNSNYGTAIAGTVSGNTITWGTATVVSSAAQSNIASLVFHAASGNFVGIYFDTTLKARVFSVSGTTITAGNGAAVHPSQTDNYAGVAIYDPVSTRILITFTPWYNPYYAKAVTLQLSGTTMSFSGATTLSNDWRTATLKLLYDTNINKITGIMIGDGANDLGINHEIFTINSGGITGVNSQKISTSENTDRYNNRWTQLNIAWDSVSGSSILGVRHMTPSAGNYLFKLYSLSISGTTRTLVQTTHPNPGNNNAYKPMTYPSSSTIYLYDSQTYALKQTSFNGTSFVAPFAYETIGSISGSLVTYLMQIGGVFQHSLLYIPESSGWFLVLGGAGSNPVVGRLQLGSTNFNGLLLGFSEGSFTNGQTAKIRTSGSLTSGHSGLTTGSQHFVQNDGSVATTPETASPRYAGIAVSATKLLVKG
jgi:hypothetical protein